MVRPTITSRKHILQVPINSVVGGTLNIVKIAHAKQDADHTVASEVNVGESIKAVYVEIWLLAGSSQPGSTTVTLEKIPGVGSSMTFIESAQLHTYTNKNQILYTTQGLTPDANGNPVPFLRMWIKIPKGKQRFGLNEKLQLNLSANVEDMSFCGVMIYKSYS